LEEDIYCQALKTAALDFASNSCDTAGVGDLSFVIDSLDCNQMACALPLANLIAYGLSMQMATDSGVDDNTSIPYSEDLCLLLISEGYDMDAWLQDIATDIGAFSESEDMEAELGNSLTSQSGNSTSPAPSRPAKNA